MCLKSLAPRDGHRSETSNGEFQHCDFLNGVNQDRNFGFAFYLDTSRVSGGGANWLPKNHGFRLPLLLNNLILQALSS